jgi:hypothetical protein
MILRLQEIEYVNSIFIVMNGTESRINNSMKLMLSDFHNIFGDKFVDNLAFIFTKWGYNKRDTAKRLRSGDSEELRIKSVNL